MTFFDDLHVGDIMMTGRQTFTAELIKSFARRFDPQRFHMDEEEAARSHFGALCASGWHTAAAWMRLMVDYRRAEDEAALARGEAVPVTGPAFGFRDLKWLKPVYAGETVRFTRTCLAHRPVASRPGWRLLTIRAEGYDSTEAKVIEFENAVLVKVQ